MLLLVCWKWKYSHLPSCVKPAPKRYEKLIAKNKYVYFFSSFPLSLQQFGKILDVEIIFNERGSKVSPVPVPASLVLIAQSKRQFIA